MTLCNDSSVFYATYIAFLVMFVQKNHCEVKLQTQFQKKTQPGDNFQSDICPDSQVVVFSKLWFAVVKGKF